MKNRKFRNIGKLLHPPYICIHKYSYQFRCVYTNYYILTNLYFSCNHITVSSRSLLSYFPPSREKRALFRLYFPPLGLLPIIKVTSHQLRKKNCNCNTDEAKVLLVWFLKFLYFQCDFKVCLINNFKVLSAIIIIVFESWFTTRSKFSRNYYFTG